VYQPYSVASGACLDAPDLGMSSARVWKATPRWVDESCLTIRDNVGWAVDFSARVLVSLSQGDTGLSSFTSIC
jgi:hypothetical protein